MHYKGVHRPIREIARELEIDVVVEGTVLRSGDRVRVSAQLIDARLDTHLWAESYDREVRDILSLHAELAQAIARQVQINLTPQEHARLAHVRPVQPEAYEAYLKGRYHLNRRSRDGLEKAVQHFQQATASDPTYAAPYSGLADCVSLLGWWAFVPPKQGCGAGKALAAKAVDLDPDLAEGHASLAWAVAYYDYDFPKCEEEFRRAITLNPNYALAHGWYGLTLSMIRGHQEAITELKQAVHLDPASAIINGMLALAYWFAREYDASLEWFKKASDLDAVSFQLHWGIGMSYLGNLSYDAAIEEMKTALELVGRTPMAVAFLAGAYAAAGRKQQTQQLMADLSELSKARYVSRYPVAWIFAAMQQTDEALAQLEAGYQERAAWMVWMDKDPRLDNLRSDPRFQGLLRRMNFPAIS
jgi:tetratricopeptide (TPR) repeat protein